MMLIDEDAFLRAIQARPDDLVPRMAFSDWLEGDKGVTPYPWLMARDPPFVTMSHALATLTEFPNGLTFRGGEVMPNPNLSGVFYHDCKHYLLIGSVFPGEPMAVTYKIVTLRFPRVPWAAGRVLDCFRPPNTEFLRVLATFNEHEFGLGREHVKLCSKCFGIGAVSNATMQPNVLPGTRCINCEGRGCVRRTHSVVTAYAECYRMWLRGSYTGSINDYTLRLEQMASLRQPLTSEEVAHVHETEQRNFVESVNGSE